MLHATYLLSRTGVRRSGLSSFSFHAVYLTLWTLVDLGTSGIAEPLRSETVGRGGGMERCSDERCGSSDKPGWLDGLSGAKKNMR